MKVKLFAVLFVLAITTQSAQSAMMANPFQCGSGSPIYFVECEGGGGAGTGYDGNGTGGIHHGHGGHGGGYDGYDTYHEAQEAVRKAREERADRETEAEMKEIEDCMKIRANKPHHDC